VFQGEAGAALAGAFIGAFAVLVGNWINRRNELRRREEQRVEQIAKTKSLVTAELVNVATGMIGAEDTLSGFVRAFLTGAATHERYDLGYLSPRLMPRTTALSNELLLLDTRTIDVLATLESNMAISKRTMDEVTRGERPFSLLSAQQIVGMVRHDMGILAQAFDQFAPTRQLQLPGQQPQLAGTILRQRAQRQD
jgi:hypothetical protein